MTLAEVPNCSWSSFHAPSSSVISLLIKTHLWETHPSRTYFHFLQPITEQLKSMAEPTPPPTHTHTETGHRNMHKATHRKSSPQTKAGWETGQVSEEKILEGYWGWLVTWPGKTIVYHHQDPESSLVKSCGQENLIHNMMGPHLWMPIVWQDSSFLGKRSQCYRTWHK